MPGRLNKPSLANPCCKPLPGEISVQNFPCRAVYFVGRAGYIMLGRKMNDSAWREFFLAASEVLGAGHRVDRLSASWCSWTTFGRLRSDAGYWTGGLPAPEDVGDSYIQDGGVWGQPFFFSDLAHLIVPREFFWESEIGPNYHNGTRVQALEVLSKQLAARGIPHRVTDLLLEIKCY